MVMGILEDQIIETNKDLKSLVTLIFSLSFKHFESLL